MKKMTHSAISELVGVCKTQKGKDMSRPDIAQYIGEMVNIEQVINLEDKYQSIEYKKVVKYSDNFDG
jgi:hypothetical protein